MVFVNLSEIFVGRVASGEIISPLIVTDVLHAKKIKADSIEGLEILIGSSENFENSASQSAGLPESQDESIFQKLVTFFGSVIFKSGVIFEETPIFNKDAAGFAVVTAGTEEVAITFDKAYLVTPLVLASITLDTAEENFKDKPAEERLVAQEALEKDVVNHDLKYFVTKRDGRGFVIKLNKKADFDIPFSWHAIAVKNAAWFRSKAPVVEPMPTVIPSTTPIPTAIPLVTPTLEPPIFEPAAEPSSTPSTPSAEVVTP